MMVLWADLAAYMGRIWRALGTSDLLVTTHQRKCPMATGTQLAHHVRAHKRRPRATTYKSNSHLATDIYWHLRLLIKLNWWHYRTLFESRLTTSWTFGSLSNKKSTVSFTFQIWILMSWSSESWNLNHTSMPNLQQCVICHQIIFTTGPL